MLATVLVIYPWLTTAALAGLVVLGPLAGAWLARRRRTTLVLLVLSLVAVAVLTLVPTSRELATGCAIERPVPRLGAVEVMANVIMVVPSVLLAGVLTRRPLVALVAGSAASVVVEAVQALVPALGRSCSTGDWLANTLGAVLGAALAAAALLLARWASGRRAGSPDGVPVAR